MQGNEVTVTIVVTINGEIKIFEAETKTPSDPYDVAVYVMDGLITDAQRWASSTGIINRHSY